MQIKSEEDRTKFWIPGESLYDYPIIDRKAPLSELPASIVAATSGYFFFYGFITNQIVIFMVSAFFLGFMLRKFYYELKNVVKDREISKNTSNARAQNYIMNKYGLEIKEPILFVYNYTPYASLSPVLAKNKNNSMIPITVNVNDEDHTKLTVTHNGQEPPVLENFKKIAPEYNNHTA